MRKRIGEFLVEQGILTRPQVERVLEHSRHKGLRFGEAGMDLGILTAEKLARVFGPNYAVDFFHLDPAYFPKTARELFPLELIARLGALALGFKTEYHFFRARKRLNVGMLNPGKKSSVAEIEDFASKTLGSNFGGIKIYLVLADQFLDVLEKVYGVSEQELSERHPLLENTLRLYLST